MGQTNKQVITNEPIEQINNESSSILPPYETPRLRMLQHEATTGTGGNTGNVYGNVGGDGATDTGS